MRLIGITGGIAMGKSTAAKWLVENHVPVADADLLAHGLVEPGQQALREIISAFGGGLIDSGGRLNRSKLAEIVFASTEARRKLEDILHPRIREAWQSCAATWRSSGVKIGAVAIPLLFETAAEKNFTDIICVACSSGAQIERLNARGWSADHARQRIAAQWPVEKKIALADRVVWSEGELAATHAQLEKIFGGWR